MKIAIIGYGKMGQKIADVARLRGHKTVSIDPSSDRAEFKSISKESLDGVDVAIDFSAANAVIQNIMDLVQFKVPVVIGTTGWYDQMTKVESLIVASQAQLLWSANFSVGMNIFMQIAQEAARKFSAFSQYEVAGIEIHHSKKLDSPSGTAIELAKIVDQEYLNRKKDADKTHFSSVRNGNEPGTHTLIFDSVVDTVELVHRARSRDGFAVGAVMAAEWLTKQKSGLYNFEQCFKEWTT